MLPPDAPFIRVIEDHEQQQQPVKKVKSAKLRAMNDWKDDEMVILVRNVKANLGHMKRIDDDQMVQDSRQSLF